MVQAPLWLFPAMILEIGSLPRSSTSPLLRWLLVAMWKPLLIQIPNLVSWLTQGSSTVLRYLRLSKRSLNGWQKRVLGNERLTTNCETGSSLGSAIGVNPFLWYTAKNAAGYQCLKTSSQYSYLM